jgi:cellulose synthase (UDP-forming)
VALGLAYLGWLTRLLWRSRAPLDLLFWAAEALAFLLLALLAYALWPRRERLPEIFPPFPEPAVDVFVPCCGEPLGVIRATLAGVKAISHRPLSVYVLDDSASPQVEALSAALGFHYLSRARAGLPLADAKSGNLNFGLSRSRGEFILVLDADQVPVPEVATRLLEFCRAPRVAYVQSRQAFFLPQGDPFYNADRIFYEVLQPANGPANAVVSCGSGVLYRRTALEEMGGFATWNVVEDFTTSYELVSRGWQGRYYPRALSRGLAPAALPGVYRQRFQWGLDSLRLFFWDSPLFKQGLILRQRLHFSVVMLSYLVSGLALPLFYLAPLGVYAWGSLGWLARESAYWPLRGGYLLATILMFRCLFAGKAPLKQFKMLCNLFPVYGLAALAALVYPPRRKPPYRLNNLQPFEEAGRWWHVAPHLTFMALHLTLPFLSLWQGWAPPELIAAAGVYSAFIIWIMGDLVWWQLNPPNFSPAMDPRQVYA